MRKGFTLVELLVVIAIIGVLSAIAFTQLNIARDKAVEAAVKAEIAIIEKAATLCLADGQALDCTAGGNFVVGGSMCGTQIWPELPEGFAPLFCQSGTSGGIDGGAWYSFGFDDVNNRIWDIVICRYNNTGATHFRCWYF